MEASTRTSDVVDDHRSLTAASGFSSGLKVLAIAHDGFPTNVPFAYVRSVALRKGDCPLLLKRQCKNGSRQLEGTQQISQSVSLLMQLGRPASSLASGRLRSRSCGYWTLHHLCQWVWRPVDGTRTKLVERSATVPIKMVQTLTTVSVSNNSEKRRVSSWCVTTVLMYCGRASRSGWQH